MSRPLSRSLAAEMRRYRHFYLFVSPFFILFVVFALYPILFSAYLSLIKWDGLTKQMFVGLNNFRSLFSDRAFYRALWNTLLIGIYHIPPMFIGAFVLAMLLNQQT